MLPLFRQGTRKRKWGTTHGRDKNRISRMNGSPSAACAGNSSRTLKSLNEVKKKNDTTLSCFFSLSEPDWPAGSDIHQRGTWKNPPKLDRDEPISMLIRFGTAVEEIAIFVPGSLCTAARWKWWEIYACWMLQRAAVRAGGRKKSQCRCAWWKELLIILSDEHLGAEIAEGSWRDFLSTSQHKLPPRDQIRI